MSDVKLCVNCKWHREPYMVPLCTYPGDIDLVTGDTYSEHCSTARIGSCGPSGRNYIQKPSILQLIKKWILSV